ncbi:MAG: hypothetical protein KAY32_02030 [Candidatus Eisenbacteria sp.]|nr:hypothetical protein [Candidatus Eisenbacteria bacterium]
MSFLRHEACLVGSFCALLIVLLGTPGALAYTGEGPKMQVRLDWPLQFQLEELRSIGDLDPMRVTPGKEIILVSTPEQVERLEALGFVVEVQIADMEAHYAAQREGYRNLGDLYSYSEAVDLLDQLHAQYPAITTAKFSIGTTHEGSTIWAMKVSDNPDIDEDEPEVFFDALHHAREPITVNVLIETIRHLCENYGTDPEATFLVDQRETYFVPVVNVDGYLYNEQNYPGGGGMWRKNRRDNEGTSCMGVDPNRNYPYEWGGTGSSSDPCSDVYHGPTPGSEPCVQAIMNLCNEREFVTHDSYHSYGGMVLFPWGYTTAHTPDDATFRTTATAMQAFCGYSIGQPGEILYTVSGGTFDWTYAEHGMFSFTTEVDGSGFWPADAEVPGLVAENIPKNLYLMNVAGAYLTLTDAVLSGGDGDGEPDPGETLDLVVTLHNDGVIGAAENAQVVLSSDDPYLQLHQATATLGTLAAGADGDNAGDPFSFTVAADCPQGHRLQASCLVTAAGIEVAYPLEWIVGEPPVLFADDMESGAGDWTHEVVTAGFYDQWHQSTSRNHTSGGGTSWKFGNTGSGDYAHYSDGALVTPAVTAGAAATLTFWHWIDAEESGSWPGQAYDGGLVEISVEGGAWTQIFPGPGYTHIARGAGPFPEGTDLYSGYLAWREEQVILDAVNGSLQFRFRFGSDSGVAAEGWYVDDLEIRGSAGGNQAPGAPALAGPPDGGTVMTALPTLSVQNAGDPDPGDALVYGFRVYDDALLTSLVLEASSIPEGEGTTEWTVTVALDDGTYHWRAHASDGSECGPCMPPAAFTVEEGAQGIAEGAWARGLRLLGATPNPAPGATGLRLQLGTGGRVRGEIFDLQGRCVRALSAQLPAGVHTLTWDGRDQGGRPVAGGVYLYRIGQGAEQQQGRVLIVR